MGIKNFFIGLFGMIFMPVTTGGAALKVMLAEQGINPYSIPFKALKAVAKESYELAKCARTRETPFAEQYVNFLRCDSYAIADYRTKPLDLCDPSCGHIYDILSANGVEPQTKRNLNADD